MTREMLKLVPVALRAASGVIAGHAAQVATAAGSVNGTAELSGVAAAALHGAFDGYCGEFSQRLSSVSAALVGATDSYTAMEETNSHKFEAITPGGATPVMQL